MHLLQIIHLTLCTVTSTFSILLSFIPLYDVIIFNMLQDASQFYINVILKLNKYLYYYIYCFFDNVSIVFIDVYTNHEHYILMRSIYNHLEQNTISMICRNKSILSSYLYINLFTRRKIYYL